MPISVGDAMLKLGVDSGDLNRGLDDVGKNIQKGVDKWKGQLRMAGAAFTAVGAAGLALVAQSKKMNASLGQTAMTIGGTTKELRNLALATTNVTFPLESVTKTFDILARAGIRDQRVLADTATAFDTLADATGSSAEEVAGQLIPAFKVFGQELPQTANELDAFTWLTKNTTVNLSDFAAAMNYVAADAGKLGISMEDMIATLAAMEAKGLSGAAATRELRTAVTQAANEGKNLNDVLGLTQEEVAKFTDEMSQAEGVTQDYADVANTQYGIMDKLKQKWSEITLQLGSFLEPLEPIMGAMAAIGPMLMVMSTGMGQAAVKTVAHTVALVAHKAAMLASAVATAAVTAAQWLLNVAMNANPIGVVITVIGLLVGALIGLAVKFQSVRDVLIRIWDNIVIIFARAVRLILESAIKPFLSGLAAVIDFGSKVVRFFNKDWGDAMKSAADSVRGAVDGAIEWTHRLEDNAQAHRDHKDAVEQTTKAVDGETRATEAYDQALHDAILTIDLGTKEAEEFTDVLDDQTSVFSDLTDEVDEAKKAMQEWQDEQTTALTKVRDLWQELVIENSELAELGIRLDDVIKHAIAMGTSQEEIARRLIQTSEAADQASALLAALGLTVSDLTEDYEELTEAQREQIAVTEAEEKRQAAKEAAEKEAEDAFAEFGRQTAGQPDWYRALAATVGNLSGEYILPAELTRELTDMVREVYEEGGDWFRIIQEIEKNKSQIWETMLDSQYKIFGDYVHLWAEIKDGIVDVAGSLTGLLGLESFQHGGIVPGVGPRLVVAHGGESIGQAAGGVTNTFHIAQLTVREEADIERVARELYRLQKLRGNIHG